jgi:hypothetical protein
VIVYGRGLCEGKVFCAHAVFGGGGGRWLMLCTATTLCARSALLLPIVWPAGWMQVSAPTRLNCSASRCMHASTRTRTHTHTTIIIDNVARFNTRTTLDRVLIATGCVAHPPSSLNSPQRISRASSRNWTSLPLPPLRLPHRQAGRLLALLAQWLALYLHSTTRSFWR